MDHELFTFRSITRAQLALRYLQAADVNASLQRTPKSLAQEGCGYAIRVRAGDRAAMIFAQNAVQYQKRYGYLNGKYREVAR